MANTLIDSLINQREFGQALALAADDTLRSLANINVDLGHIGPTGQVNVVPPNLDLEDIPDFTVEEITVQPAPESGELLGVNITSLPPMPSSTVGNQPEFKLPPTPAQMPTFQGVAPTLDEIESIGTLDVNTMLASITKPVLTKIVIDDAPPLDLPEFAAVKPSGAPTAPTNIAGSLSGAYSTISNIIANTTGSAAQAWFAQNFPQHAVGVAALESRLTTYLAGGTGVNPEVASAIYEIERGKRHAEYRRLERSALLDSAKRGFTLPDGTMLAAQIAARTALADANADSAAQLRKVLFDLEQKNLQFAVDQARQWRDTAITAYLTYIGTLATLNGQSIEYAKAVVDAIVQLFNAAVRGYEASLGGYKAEAEVYGEKVKVSLAKLDVYRAQLEGEKAKAQVNGELVRIYEVQIRAVETMASVYAKRVEAIVAKAGLQKLRFDVYDAQVRAFASFVSAKEAEYRGFSAQVGGQAALQESYSERVRARTAELEGYRAQVSAITEQVKTQLSYNDGVTRQYESSVRAFAEWVRSQQIVVQSNVEQYRAKVEGIARTNEGRGKVADLKLKEWESGRMLVLKNAEQQIVAAKNEAEIRLGSLGLQVKVAEAIGTNTSRMAQAAMAGISATLSNTYAESKKLADE